MTTGGGKGRRKDQASATLVLYPFVNTMGSIIIFSLHRYPFPYPCIDFFYLSAQFRYEIEA